MSDELLGKDDLLVNRGAIASPSTSQNNPPTNVTRPLNLSDKGVPATSSSQIPIASSDGRPEVKINYDADQYKKLNCIETWTQFKNGAALLFSDPKKYFQLEERGTDVKTELKGGFATFLTMSYILAVNPGILGATGVLPKNAVLTATAISAAICNIMMGLFTNFPLAVAAGMGLNAYIAYSVILGPDNITWQAAMGLVVWDGILILILVLIGLREAVLDAIPDDLKRAISVGIGMFIAFIGAVDARLVVVPSDTVTAIAIFKSTSILPPVGASSFKTPEVIVCFFGLFVMAIMLNRRIPGAVIIGIILSTILSAIFGLIKTPIVFETPDFSLAFKADLGAPFKAGGGILWAHLFSFTMVDFFDTLGTMTASSSKSGLTSPNGRIPNSTPILIIDSLSALIGGLFGASSNTAYIECCTGICEGARTGLHSIFVGLLFLISVGLAPIVAFVPQCATAPALLLIGFMMCDQITDIKFDTEHYQTGIPAFLTILLIPMTYSIAHGIGYGFITYTVIMIGSGQGRSLAKTTTGTIIMYGCSFVFVLFFIFAEI